MPLDAQRRVLDVAQIAGLLVHRGLGHKPAQDVREPRGRTPEPQIPRDRRDTSGLPLKTARSRRCLSMPA